MRRPIVTRPELHTLVTAALVFIVGAVAPSCGAEPLPVRDCTPGASLACACVGGSTGAQICDGAGHLEACVCPDASAVGPRDGAAVDGAPIVDAVTVDTIATDTAAAVDHQSADVVDAAGLDATDGARADSPDVVDAAPADAGPVTYDLDARAPGSLRWRVVARTSRGDCDVTGNTSTGYTCTSDAWRVTVTCPGADAGSPVQFIGERGDAGWSVALVEPDGAREAAARVTVEARPDAFGGFTMHTRFTVPAGATRGATGIPGRTVATDTADVWLFGCTLGL